MGDDEGEHTSLILLLESLRDGEKPCSPALPQEDGPSTHNRLDAELHQGGVVADVHDCIDQVVLRTRPRVKDWLLLQRRNGRRLAVCVKPCRARS